MIFSANGKLRLAARLAFVGGAAGAGMASSVVLAQDATSDTSGITVTGTLLRRVDTETANPVVTVSRKAIENSGVTSMGQLLEQLPQLTGDALTPQVNNGGAGDGASTISLRGLGSARTLILVDGKRTITNDVNTFPVNMIDHVEILLEGAATVYGSDAIGGVVNFITRKRYSGTEIVGNAGYATDKTDASKLAGSVTTGFSNSTGSFVFGLSYDKQNEVKGTDRDVSKDAFAVIYNHVTQLGSSRIPTGLFNLSGPTSAGGIANNGGSYDFVDANGNGCNQVTRIPKTPGLTAGTTTPLTADYECRASLPVDQQTYNYQAENLVYVPSDRIHMFASGQHNFADTVHGYTSAFFTHVSGHNQLASEAFDSTSLSDPNGNALNPTISAQSEYNPFGVDIPTYKFRAVETGDRKQFANENIYQGTAGVKVDILDRFTWDTSFTYSREDDSFVNYGYLNVGKLNQEVGPSSGGACTSGGAPVANCTPIDILGSAGATYGTLSTPVSSQDTTDLRIANSNISGDLFTWWAGSVQAALGAEWRQYDLTTTPDSASQQFALSEDNGLGTSGSYNVQEYYGELYIPLLKNLPGAHSLSADIGTRYSRYSNFSDTQNSKFQIEYRPTRDLLVRATYSDIFRAPTISDLYGGASNSAPSFTDPCNNYNPATPNPACVGVPAGYNQNGPYGNGSQGNVRVGGNPNLGPERGYTTDFGFVYDPDFYKPLTVHADFWDYRIRDAIEGLGLQGYLDACANTGQAQYCGDGTPSSPFYREGGTLQQGGGNIIGGFEGPSNVGTLFTDGYDFGFSLLYPHTPAGSFEFSLNGTYLDKFQQFVGVIGEHYSQAGEVGGANDFIGGGYPRWKFDASLDWSWHDLDIVFRNRFVSGERDDGGQDGAGNRLGLDATGIGYVGNQGFYQSYGIFGAGQCNSGQTSGVTSGNAVIPYACKRYTGYADYDDIAISYKVKKINTSFTVGMNDIGDQRAPLVLTYGPAFNYDASNYDVTGRYVYGRIVVKFK